MKIEVAPWNRSEVDMEDFYTELTLHRIKNMEVECSPLNTYKDMFTKLGKTDKGEIEDRDAYLTPASSHSTDIIPLIQTPSSDGLESDSEQNLSCCPCYPKNRKKENKARL